MDWDGWVGQRAGSCGRSAVVRFGSLDHWDLEWGGGFQVGQTKKASEKELGGREGREGEGRKGFFFFKKKVSLAFWP